MKYVFLLAAYFFSMHCAANEIDEQRAKYNYQMFCQEQTKKISMQWWQVCRLLQEMLTVSLCASGPTRLSRQGEPLRFQSTSGKNQVDRVDP